MPFLVGTGLMLAAFVIGGSLIAAGLYMLRLYGRSFEADPEGTMTRDVMWSALIGKWSVPAVFAVLLVIVGVILCAMPFAALLAVVKNVLFG